MSKEYTYEEACNKLIEITDAMEQPEEGSAILAALIKVHKADKVSDNWDDFPSMLSDMKQHALANGQAIEIKDRPHQLRWAWECTNTGKTWSIKISSIRKYISSLEELGETTKADIMRRCAQTQEGKHNLLDMINGK